MTQHDAAPCRRQDEPARVRNYVVPDGTPNPLQPLIEDDDEEPTIMDERAKHIHQVQAALVQAESENTRLRHRLDGQQILLDTALGALRLIQIIDEQAAAQKQREQDASTQRPLAELGLSFHLSGLLSSAGLETVADVIRHGEYDLTLMRGFGPVSMRELRQRIPDLPRDPRLAGGRYWE